MARGKPDSYYEIEYRNKTEEVTMTELPKWEMDDNGLITASSLQHKKAMLLTFTDTALAHNNKILQKKMKEVVVEVQEPLLGVVTPMEEIGMGPETVEEKDAEPEKEIVAYLLPKTDVTKAELNILLAGMYTAQGVRRWWYRPRKSLGGKTPTEIWDEDPQRVVNIVKGFREGF